MKSNLTFMDDSQSYTVARYMKGEVISLENSAILKEAVALMLQRATNGLVVVDAQKKLVGILSSWDIIQFMILESQGEDAQLSFESRVQKIANEPVSKFMTPYVHAVKAEDSIFTAATLLSDFHIRQLPVVDNEGNLTGYINRSDVKRAMGDAMGIARKV